MSTTNAIAVRGSYAQRMLATAHGLLEASLIAWRTRREHRNAIAQLRTMSDAELRDVGIDARKHRARRHVRPPLRHSAANRRHLKRVELGETQ